MSCFNAGCFNSMDLHYVTVSDTGEQKWVIYCENEDRPFVILNEEDIELWELLQWEMCDGSSVLTVRTENTVKLAVVLCVLASLNFVACMSLLPVDNAFIKTISSLLFCGVALALEFWAFMYLSPLLRRARCFYATYQWIIRRVQQKKVTYKEYHNILTGLSYARCHHKAQAARAMTKII